MDVIMETGDAIHRTEAHNRVLFVIVHVQNVLNCVR